MSIVWMIENKRNVFFVCLSCLCVYLANHWFGGANNLVLLALSLLGLAICDSTSPLCIYTFAVITGIPIDTWAEAIVLILSIIPFFLRQKSIPKNVFWILVIPQIVFLTGYLLGEKSNSAFLVIQMFAYTSFVLVAFMDTKDLAACLLLSFMLAGMCVIVTILLAIRGNAALLLGRLHYHENVRDLATALMVPSYLFVSGFVASGASARNGKWYNSRLVLSGLVALFLGIMLLTYSRGALLALGGGIVVMLFQRSKNVSFKQYALIGALLVLAALLLENLNLNQDKMASTRSAEIRMDIYDFYVNKVTHSGLLRFLVGFGSGDIRRTAQDSPLGIYYAHSSILDYFFQYGVCGACVVAFMIWTAFRRVAKGKNAVMSGFFVMSVLSFAPYGSSENLIFHLLLGLCCNEQLLRGLGSPPQNTGHMRSGSGLWQGTGSAWSEPASQSRRHWNRKADLPARSLRCFC